MHLKKTEEGYIRGFRWRTEKKRRLQLNYNFKN